jgi:hypothetical protein
MKKYKLKFSFENGFGIAIGWNDSKHYKDYMMLLPFCMLVLTIYKRKKITL